MTQQRTKSCQICGHKKRPHELIPGKLVLPSVVEIIRQKNPDWDQNRSICINDLRKFRALYIQQILEKEKGVLTALDKEVIDSVKDADLITENINHQFERNLTFGERLSDHMASFGGSWSFLIWFMLALTAWIILNGWVWHNQGFDPYPYIFLNLILSCLASIQAPIIMMSQNRQEEKDRMRSEQDYLINLKAELEIRNLNAKMDQLMIHQWQRLIEIQQLQTEMMNEISNRLKGRHHT